MSLIKSISGIRGTIGGLAGESLTPLDIVKYTAAYATFIRKSTTKDSNTIVVGRDARLSGGMVNDIVIGTLSGMGFNVINIGLATTPTTELAVVWEKACGGIINSIMKRREAILCPISIRPLPSSLAQRPFWSCAIWKRPMA